MNNIWIQLAAAATIIMMLVFLYPTAKHWAKHGPKAQKGDWQAVILPLLAVVAFVILLIAMVR